MLIYIFLLADCMESGIEILDDSADSCSGTKSKQLTPEDSSAVKTEEGSADEANSKSASAEPKNWESDLLQSSDLKPLDGFSFPFVKTEYPIDPLPQSRSLLFKGLRYYAIGVTANIKKLLCDCSAVEESNLSELVTHVIAGKPIENLKFERLKFALMHFSLFRQEHQCLQPRSNAGGRFV